MLYSRPIKKKYPEIIRKQCFASLGSLNDEERAAVRNYDTEKFPDIIAKLEKMEEMAKYSITPVFDENKKTSSELRREAGYKARGEIY